MLLSPRELLRDSVRLFRAEFWMYVGYAAWLMVPIAAFYFASALPKGTVTTMLVIGTILAELFVSLWIAICLMRATQTLEAGHKLDVKIISQQSLRRIQPVLIVGFLQALIVLGGFLLLVIPAILFWVWYAFAQIGAAIDDQSPVAALSSSRALVRGRFFPVLWRLVAGPVVLWLLYAFTLASVLLLLSNVLGQDVAIMFSDARPLWVRLLDVIANLFVIPLFFIYTVLLYKNLKATPLEKVSPVA